MVSPRTLATPAIIASSGSIWEPARTLAPKMEPPARADSKSRGSWGKEPTTERTFNVSVSVFLLKATPT